MALDKTGGKKQDHEKSNNVSKGETHESEKSYEKLKQTDSELSEEIFRGLFFVDEQYQNRGGSNWQLFG